MKHLILVSYSTSYFFYSVTLITYLLSWRNLWQYLSIVADFLKYYNGQTPVYFAYKAGYSGSEHLIQTTLDGLQKAADETHEKFLGLIYIGPCLALNKKEFCQ